MIAITTSIESVTNSKRNKKPKLPLPPVLSVTEEEAAEALRISTRLLWTLTNEGIIQCVKIGKAKRYAFAKLQRFVDEAGELTKENR